MARTKYTVTFPAAKAGDEVTWPNTVKVYADANIDRPMGNGYIEAAAGSFTGWSDASSVTFTRAGTDAVTVTAASPTGTGAAVPTAAYLAVAPAPSGGDDTAALQALLNALPVGGTLRLQAGVYTLNSGLTVGNRCRIEGAGGGGRKFNATVLNFTPATGQAITVNVDGCHLEKFALFYTGSAPTAVYGIVLANGYYARLTDVTVDSFNICVSFTTGSEWHMHRCTLSNPQLYALQIQNTTNTDEGDMGVVDCSFVTRDVDATAAIHYVSGGGLRLVNCKFNNDWRDPTGVNLKDKRWRYGVFLDVAAGVTTSDLLITNCSIENYYDTGVFCQVAATGQFYNPKITGNQFFAVNRGSDAPRAVNLFAGTANGINTGVIANNDFSISGGTVNPAIALTNTADIVVGDNANSGWPWMLTETTCTRTTHSYASIGAPRLLLPEPAGHVYTKPVGQVVANALASLGVLYLSPLWLGKRYTIEELGASVKTAQAGATIYVALYLDDGTGKPAGSPVLVSGALDASTTGYKSYVASYLTYPGVHWLGCVAQSSGTAPTLGFSRVTGAVYDGTASNIIDNDYTCYAQSGLGGAPGAIGTLAKALTTPTVVAKLS